MTRLQEDKVWAEIHTSEEWARTEQEKFIPLNTPSPKEIAREVSQLIELKRNRFRPPHEL